MVKEILVSAVIIAKNEEKKISDCLEALAWSDEIIVVDTGSTDSTVSIAKEYKARVFHHKGGSYKDWRNAGKDAAKGEWILYVDADERVTPLLKKEILKVIKGSSKDNGVYAIPRKNIILGYELKHGGWWPDYVIRLFRKTQLKSWKNELHEQPVFSGELRYLHYPLIHLKHDNLEEMVDKTNEWSLVEATLLYNSGHPQMVWWRFLRIMATEVWLRLIKQRAFLDGGAGILYALYQVWSRFITYAKLWELQLGKIKK